MAKGQMTKEVLDRLTDFLVTNIEDKAMDGITYAMALKENDKALIEKCLKIKEEVTAAGFEQGEVFRVYELSNGYIFDMDISIAKYITSLLAKAVYKEKNIQQAPTDLIASYPEKRRMEDMKKLADYCKKQFKAGNTRLEVALFSRNNVPRIVINGKASSADKSVDGKQVLVQYNAYAIRHWDIEEINRNLLGPVGIMIDKLTPCEVIPSKTGVRFILNLSRVH